MKSVKLLREQGFIVRSANGADGCTEVYSNKSFYHYNPQFAKSPAEVYNALKPASRTGSDYHIIIAGEYPGDDGEIPLAIVDEQLRQQAKKLYEQREAAREAARVAEQQFYDSVRAIMNY